MMVAAMTQRPNMLFLLGLESPEVGPQSLAPTLRLSDNCKLTGNLDASQVSSLNGTLHQTGRNCRTQEVIHKGQAGCLPPFRHGGSDASKLEAVVQNPRSR